jgi:hypothetical protein
MRQNLPECVIFEEVTGIGLGRRHGARLCVGTTESDRKIWVSGRD